MADEIRPALTPEEWRAGRVHAREEHNWGQYVHRQANEPGGVCIAWAGESHCTSAPELKHALAALALHGQPFGFTRDDVTILRQMPAYVCGLGLGPDPHGVAHFIEGLAARIAALLPPEDAHT